MPLDATNFVVADNAAVVRLLVRGKSRIRNPANWCQKTARDGDALCSMASLWSEASIWPDDQAEEKTRVYVRAKALLDSVAQSRGFTGFMHLNDEMTHACVMAAFDEAIETARREG